MAVMWWMPSSRMTLLHLCHIRAPRVRVRSPLRPGLGARPRRLLGRLAALVGLALARGGRLLGRGPALGGAALGAVLEVRHEVAQVADTGRCRLAGAGAARAAEGVREVACHALAQPVRAQALEEDVSLGLRHRCLLNPDERDSSCPDPDRAETLGSGFGQPPPDRVADQLDPVAHAEL